MSSLTLLNHNNGCYLALKVHSWTLYLLVDLAKKSGCLDLDVMKKTVPQNLRERSRSSFMVVLENIGGVGVDIFDVVSRGTGEESK